MFDRLQVEEKRFDLGSIRSRSTMQPAEHYQQQKKNIFILSGQSNMAGRGGVHHHRWDDVIPPECQPHPSILRFTAGSSWELARDPLHADIDTAKTCGVGPGMSFANSLLSHHHSDPAVAVGLVPCAVGGTAIKEWEKGSRLYEEMVRRAGEAVEKGGGGAIRAILWYQGESDTEECHAVESYRANMKRFVRDVRSDIGLPELPFIQVALASGKENWMETVREAQLQMGTNVPNVVCVDAKGLQLNEDHMHLTTNSQVVLGKMLAEAYTKHFLDPSRP